MKESIGGLPAITLIIFFIVVISGYIAFTINYSKAFKVNSKIKDIIEYKADKSGVIFNNISSYGISSEFGSMQNEINKYLGEVGYSVNANQVKQICTGDNGGKVGSTSGFYVPSGSENWCIREVYTDIDGDSGDTKKTGTVYFEVKTFVSVDIPILNKLLMGNKFFQVNGSTKTLYINK